VICGIHSELRASAKLTERVIIMKLRRAGFCTAILLLFSQILFAADQTTSVKESAKSADSSTTRAGEAALKPAPKKGRFLKLHESFLKRGKEGPIGVLFLGDSITERWSTAPKVWEKYYGKYHPANFGIGGDRTQNVLWRIEHGELDGISPRVMVLMIGTNNTNSDQPEIIANAVTEIVEKSRKKLPDTKILLLGIFPRNSKKSMPENIQMKRILEINKTISKLDNGSSIRYLDISKAFLEDGLVPKKVMPDGLHPSVEGYERWAKAMQPLLSEMMKEK
jgi:beta-glucosidase